MLRKISLERDSIMKNFDKEQTLNYLAIELLERLGNVKPSQQQIDLLTDLLGRVALEYQLNFDQRLTKREIECLFWAAQGRTSDEIADLLKIKKTTVESHRREIIRKLNSQNMAQAVYNGVRYGYVPLIKT